MIGLSKRLDEGFDLFAGETSRFGLEYAGNVGHHASLEHLASKLSVRTQDALERVQSICRVLSTIISAMATPSNLDVSPNMSSIRRRHHDEEHRTQNATDGLNTL